MSPDTVRSKTDEAQNELKEALKALNQDDAEEARRRINKTLAVLG